MAKLLLFFRPFVFGYLEHIAKRRFEHCDFLGAQLFPSRFFELSDLLLDRLQSLLKGLFCFFASRVFGIGSDAPILEFGPSEDPLQPIVVGLQNGIEFVVMAAGTANRQAEKYRTNGTRYLGQP